MYKSLVGMGSGGSRERQAAWGGTGGAEGPTGDNCINTSKFPVGKLRNRDEQRMLIIRSQGEDAGRRKGLLGRDLEVSLRDQD